MNNYKDFILGGFSSSLSLSLFYPFEIAKLRIQNHQALKVHPIVYYRGLVPSMFAVFPEKGFKLFTYSYLKDSGYSFFPSIIGTTVVQSLISTPVEAMRIQKQLRLANKITYRGFHATIIRDIIFNSFLFGIADGKKDLPSNIMAGISSSAIATPFDYVKTLYQSGQSHKEIYQIIKKSPTKILKGIAPRVASIGGLYSMTFFIYNNLKDII